MSSVTLRPNGTDVAADSLTGGATTHAVTSDDSDASYYTDNEGLDAPVIVSLGTSALPAGFVTKQIRARCRSRGDSATVTVNFGVVSYAGGPVSMSTTLTTYEGAYSPVTLTQTQIDGLQAYTAGNWVGSGSAYRVAELYVDLVYVTIPVVALDAITDPYTASTVIPISWVNTLDSDGGAQTHYQAWVTADSGGATVYDSGVVASSSTSASVGPLANGANYTVHIKVAQTVNGSQHWSAEDTQAAVTMSVTTVDVSSVTAAADNANAKITVTVTRDAADGAWGFVEVERSTDGSVTWEAVRGATYVDPPLADTFVIDDYEVPNGTAAKYRARATYLSSGLPITSAWTTQSDTTTWTSTAVWFKVPGSPSLNDTFPFKVYPSATRPQRRGVFYVLGASRPVVVSDVRSSPEARCTVQTETEADATSLLAILDEPVVLIQAPTTMKRWGSRYCSIGDVSDDPVDPNTYGNSGYATWSFSAVEVDSPADPDAGTM